MKNHLYSHPYWTGKRGRHLNFSLLFRKRIGNDNDVKGEGVDDRKMHLLNFEISFPFISSLFKEAVPQLSSLHFNGGQSFSNILSSQVWCDAMLLNYNTNFCLPSFSQAAARHQFLFKSRKKKTLLNDSEQNVASNKLSQLFPEKPLCCPAVQSCGSGCRQFLRLQRPCPLDMKHIDNVSVSIRRARYQYGPFHIYHVCNF